MSNHFERRILSKLSLKSSRSAPNHQSQKPSIGSNKVLTSSKSMDNNNPSSSLLNIKSAVPLHSRTAAQESEQQLNAMHRMVDQTDNDLRHALEQTATRREQLDELHYRSEEMLSKNENLVFGITNYRKNQERDLFWRRFRYTAFGAITIGVIILLIILSMTSKRPASSSQVIDIRHSNADLSIKDNKDIISTVTSSTSPQRRRKRQILSKSNEFLFSRSKSFSWLDNNI